MDIMYHVIEKLRLSKYKNALWSNTNYAKSFYKNQNN